MCTQAAAEAPAAEPKKRGRKKKVVEEAAPEASAAAAASGTAAAASEAALDAPDGASGSGSDQEAGDASELGVAGRADLDSGLVGSDEDAALEALRNEILPLRMLFPEVDDMQLSPAAADLLYKLQDG